MLCHLPNYLHKHFHLAIFIFHIHLSYHFSILLCILHYFLIFRWAIEILHLFLLFAKNLLFNYLNKDFIKIACLMFCFLIYQLMFQFVKIVFLFGFYWSLYVSYQILKINLCLKEFLLKLWLLVIQDLYFRKLHYNFPLI